MHGIQKPKKVRALPVSGRASQVCDRILHP